MNLFVIFATSHLILVSFSQNVLGSLVYPEARRDPNILDEYYGVQIGDPYRLLEDPESVETKQFVEAQKALSSEFLCSIEDRVEIEERLKSFLGYERFGPYIKKQDKYFYFHNSGLQNHNVLMKLNNISDHPESFLDPNLLSEDGSTALYPYYYSFSSDAQHFVYGLTHGGSDWLEGKIRNVDTNQDLPEILQHIKWPEFSFTKSGDGVFYSRFPLGEDGNPITSNPQIFYHKLNTPQTEDTFVVAEDENPDWFLFAEVSYCGNYLVLKPQPDFQSNGVKIASLLNFNGSQDLEFFSLFEEPYDARYIYITNTETEFIFLSDKDAPNFRLISVQVDLNSGTVGPIVELVPESPNKILKSADAFNGDKLVLMYLEDVKHKLQIHFLNNGTLLQEIDNLPFEGVITEISCFRDNSEFSFRFENIVSPGLIARCIISTEAPTVECETLHEMNLNGVDTGEYEMNQVFVESKDGTNVPLFIGHKKNVSKNGQNPTLLYGYGGFNVDVLPSFNLFRFGFIEIFGGIYASASLRGGAEYGEPWHQAGSGLNKQNTFDDFLSVAQFLIKSNYTNSKRLVIEGASNGGLLLGASVNQMPNLFAVALPQVGLLDMLRFQKTSAIGYAWCSEYGCSDNSPTEFNNLYGYSPLHNIRVESNEYPAMLISTADNDDRVAPSNSFKYAAELQFQISRAINQSSPVLLRVTPKSGHNYEDMPLEQQVEGYTDSYAFVAQVFRTNSENIPNSSMGMSAQRAWIIGCSTLILINV